MAQVRGRVRALEVLDIGDCPLRGMPLSDEERTNIFSAAFHRHLTFSPPPHPAPTFSHMARQRFEGTRSSCCTGTGGSPCQELLGIRGEADPGARRCRFDNVAFHFFVLEQCLSLRELLQNKVLTLAFSLPPWSQTPGLVTALCQVMTPCPPGVQVTHQALRWLHAPAPPPSTRPRS